MTAKWISYKKNPPKEDGLYIVANEKGYLHNTFALYHKREDVFTLHSPGFYTTSTLTLDVSHYIPIPFFQEGMDYLTKDWQKTS